MTPRIPPILFAAVASCWAQVSMVASGGWREAAWATWKPVAGAERYDVYSVGNGKQTLLDDPLVRDYGTYLRADALGLVAGSYTLKVVPVVAGKVRDDLAATTPALGVKAQVREGFGFESDSGRRMPGAYASDGALKAGAKVLYVTASTVNTVQMQVVVDAKGTKQTCMGLSAILTARGKGFDKTPLDIRQVGLLQASSVDGLTDGIYTVFHGANATDRTIDYVTYEGVGMDATVSGFGFHLKRSKGIEIKNLGIMLFGDDGVSLEGDTRNTWIHHCDFFYGKPGSDADQVKGDGSIDMKYNSSDVTISFNRFHDCGKTSFAGGATESGIIRFTYHHNWFDHSDSRHPRLTHATTHVYNNFYDGVAGMGVLSTEGSSAFVEANRFRHCPYPMMINMQGTNFSIWPDGEQAGGIVKAFANSIEGASKLVYQTESVTSFDAWLAASRSEKIPESVKTLKGGNIYSNFDTDASMYAYAPDDAKDVEANVRAWAGRLGGGDLVWNSVDAVDDTSHVINAALKSAITGYATKLVRIQGELAAGAGSRHRNEAFRNIRLVGGRLEWDGAGEVESISVKDLAGRTLAAAGPSSRGIDLSDRGTGLVLVEIFHRQGSTRQIVVRH